MRRIAYRIAAPVLALVYPFLLAGFHGSVNLTNSYPIPGTVLAAICLCAAFLAPLIALGCFIRLAATGFERGAIWAASLAVASPAIFTFLGVVLYMLHYPAPELAVWVIGWIVISILAGLPGKSVIGGATQFSNLRSIHGILAAIAVAAFLVFHIFNHLTGLAGGETHRMTMKIGRYWYRSAFVEPVLVLVMLSIVSTGSTLFWRRLSGPLNLFQALQAASGSYLLFFVLGHMNSVFVYARHWLRIDTDWSFATGAPAGLIGDPWNIRLVVHYGLGVFFLGVHLAGGARIVLKAHGFPDGTCDRIVVVGSILSATLAGAILIGMCGVHIFSAP